MAEEKKSRIEADIESLEKGIFTGEEGGDERSSPHKDFIASIFVGALGIFAMILAVQLDKPESIYTAPGLLPFVTGASLVVMAIGLFVKTKRRHGLEEMLKSDGVRAIVTYLSDIEQRRTLLLPPAGDNLHLKRFGTTGPRGASSLQRQANADGNMGQEDQGWRGP